MPVSANRTLLFCTNRTLSFCGNTLACLKFVQELDTLYRNADTGIMQ